MVVRRELIRRGVWSAVGLSLAVACAPPPAGTPTPGAARGAAAAKVQLPTNVPVQGPRADLPGNADGIDPGYVTFPAELFKAVQDAPTNGGTVNIMVWNITQPMTPMEQNAA
jgi:putative aldouronate transport system substrate-binding protein